MARKTTERPLTEKQERFCQFYLDTGNASEAYRMAYDTEKMKPEVIWKEACILLDNRKVAVRIEELRKERAEATRVKRETVEEVLMGIVTAQPSDLLYTDTKTGKLKTRTPSQLKKATGSAIKVMRNAQGTLTYEFASKTEAARLLGAWNGWDAPTVIENNINERGEKVIRFGGFPKEMQDPE